MVKDWKIAEVIESLDYDCLEIVNINNRNESFLLGQKKFTIINVDKVLTKEYADIMEIDMIKRFPALVQLRDTAYDPIYNELKLNLSFEEERVEVKFGVGTYERQKASEEGLKSIIKIIKKNKPLLVINDRVKGVLI